MSLSEARVSIHSSAVGVGAYLTKATRNSRLATTMVVSGNSEMSGGDWERDLGESGVKRFNADHDDGALLVVKCEGT
jgi:hypothetical protein